MVIINHQINHIKSHYKLHIEVLMRARKNKQIQAPLMGATAQLFVGAEFKRELSCKSI